MAMYFVTSTDDDTDFLKEAFELTKNEGIESKWLQKDLNDYNALTKDDFVVVGNFEDDFFKDLISLAKQQKFRIVGPLCVTTCYQLRRPLPKLSHPIYNMAMLDVVACCTSVAKDERREVLDFVTLMGGKVSKDFTADVTHLVAGEVGSKKYSVAYDLNRPVLLPAWVFYCWKESSKQHLVATDDELMQKFKCPMFKGCTICVSGLDDRQKIKKLVTDNGGSYSPELNMRTCTHLLVKSPHGEKFEYAKQWKIHCVHPDWFYKCINVEHWIPEQPFIVNKDIGEASFHLAQNVSTVNNTMAGIQFMNKSRGSSTTGSGRISSEQASIASSKAAEVAKKHMKFRESVSSCDTGTFRAERTFDDGTKLSFKKIDPYIADLSNINLTETSNFLDGCRIFLDGITPEKIEIFRKIINNGGATRYSKMNDNVTHVILGEATNEDIKASLLALEQLPIVVGEKWLIDSLLAGQCLNEEEYSLLHHDANNQIKSKENHLSAEDNKSKKLEPSLVDDLNMNVDINHDDDDEIFQQYLGEQVGKGLHNEIIDQEEEYETNEDGNLLSGLSFEVEGYKQDESEEICNLIRENGGKIVSKIEADYIIVPMTYHEREREVSANKVTVCWLEQSLEMGEVLKTGQKFIFRPFYIDEESKPLTECVVSVSQFTGIEREHLLDLLTLLGACVQDYFARANSGKLKASTHLVLKEPVGQKYEAAIKWDIPAVSDRWLYACAEAGKHIPVDRYLIDGSYLDDQGETVTSIDAHDKVDSRNKTNTFDTETMHVKKYLEPTHQIHLSTKELGNAQAEGGLSCTTMDFMDGKISTKTPLKVSKSFRPSFDLADAMDAVTSPAFNLSQRRKSRCSRGSFPFDNLFDQNIQKALQTTQGSSGCVSEQSNGFSCTQRPKQVKQNGSSILDGVVLVVSKKLGQRQTNLHNLASSLGADCRFLFDESCTHFIHEGKANDNMRDIQQARTSKKLIVSPYWVEDCAEHGKRLEECLYPCTYNPRLALSVISSGKKHQKSEESFVKDESATHERAVQNESPVRKKQTEIYASKVPAPEVDTAGNLTEIAKENSTKDVSSLHERLEFQKKMEEIMAATKAINGGLRRSKRHRISSVPTTDEQLSSRHSLSKKRRRQSSQKSSGDSSKSESGTAPQDRRSNDEPEVEPSQGDVISYDDPAGRLERERILAQFKMAGCSQDPESCDLRSLADEGHNFLDNAAVRDKLRTIHEFTENSSGLNKISSENEDTSALKEKRHSTDGEFKAPPINLQITRPVQAPVPVNLLDEEEDSKMHLLPSQSTVHHFLLSGMSQQEKVDYSALIEQLGGTVFDSQHYNPQCTHVVVGTPNRNEKFLASVAAGKWILHTSYLEASREAGYFVLEEEHEWGSETEPSKLASSAKRWRIRLAQERQIRDRLGAFEGWRIYLCVDKSRQPGFKRLLEAGGASVLAVRPPFAITSEVSHMFVDPSKTKTSGVNLKDIHLAGILVLKPEYIAEYLTQDPAPASEKFLLPELLQSAGDPTSSALKRKSEEESSQSSKRLRQ